MIIDVIEIEMEIETADLVIILSITLTIIINNTILQQPNSKVPRTTVIVIVILAL